MKKYLLRFSAFALLFGLSIQTEAQSVQIGNNQFPTSYTNNNDYGPIRNLPTGAASGRWAYIYPSSLLTIIPDSAQISSLEFFRRNQGTSMDSTFNANLKIYMRNTSAPDFGTGNIDWVAGAATALLVFDGNPAQYLGMDQGFVRFPLDTFFTYTAGSNIEMYIQYTQAAAGVGIQFGYDNSASVPAYVDLTTKYVINSVDTFASNMTNLNNLRKPTIRFNFPSQFNIGAQKPTGQQFGNIGDVIVPGLEIRNTGLQTSSNITITATGPNGYISSRQVTSLDVDSVVQVNFDTLVTTAVSTGDIVYLISNPNDGYADDDTLRSPLIIQDPNATAGIFDNGPILTHPGGGHNGLGLSQLTPPLSTLGSNANGAGVFRIMEDFILPGESNYDIDSFIFYGYQTGSTNISTFTGIKALIYDGLPDEGGRIIAGDSLDNYFFNTYFTNIYRASANSPADSTRPIMAVVGQFFNPVSLRGGVKYYIQWAFEGTLASGPWQPLLSLNGVQLTGNALQRTASGYQPLDGGGTGFAQGAPFRIHYAVNTTSVNELDPNAAVIGQPYPNPSIGVSYVNLELKRDEQVAFEILDITGKVVAEANLGRLNPGKHSVTLPVEQLQAGLYLVKIKSGDSIVNRKLQLVR